MRIYDQRAQVPGSVIIDGNYLSITIPFMPMMPKDNSVVTKLKAWPFMLSTVESETEISDFFYCS